MQLDSKNKKKTNIKNKNSENNKVLKNKKETNIDKNKSIVENFKSSKKANIKKTSENNNTENVDLLNL